MKNRNRFFCTFACALIVSSVSAQEKPLVVTIDSSLTSAISWDGSISLLERCYDKDIDHSPSGKTAAFVKKHRDLLTVKPTEKNFEDYYTMAWSLWDENRVAESKQLFLTILNSKEKFYTGNYHNNSDIPGDTSSNVYGYGSFTTNYKHYASVYLAKIALEEGQNEQALLYIKDADTKYQLTYNCGTGHRMYRSEMDGLLILCHEKLGQNDAIIDGYLKNCFEHCSSAVVRAVKAKYSQTEIGEQLEAALNSIVVSDTFPSMTTFSDGESGKEVVWNYITGRGTMQLFGQQLDLPQPDMKDGEVISREHFVNDFKTSAFYRELTGTE